MIRKRNVIFIIYLVFCLSIVISNYLACDDFQNHTTNDKLYAKLHCVGIDDVHWTSGFWGDRFQACHETMIPNLWDIFRNPEISAAYTNFKIAAGLEPGEHHGPKFNDGDFYKWLEAVAYTIAITRDRTLENLLDDIIAVVAKAQRGDGYLHTPVIIEQMHGKDSYKEIHDQLHFETYNIGHLMTTASVHFRATGKTTLLQVAMKAAKYLTYICENNPDELARITICPSHYMGLMDLYRVTNDQHYVNLAQRLIDIRSLTDSGTDHNQDRIPFREQTTAVGHAVRGNYLYAGVADIYLETGDNTLLAPLQSIWNDVVFRKMYVTGSTGALYDGASPDGSKKHNAIQLVHQAYGRSYQLPNITAYNETCATIGFGLWNWRMLQITGQAKYADMLELALYNGILSGVSLDGKHFFYTNPLRAVNDLPFELRWSGERQTYFSSFCCPPNVVRIISQVNQYAYSISDEGIWVNLFGSNELDTCLPDGSRIVLKQQTKYPWDGNVSLEINSVDKTDFAIMVRVPGWTSDANIRVNNNPLETKAKPGSYFTIKRNWSQGDRIEIIFPMDVKLLEAHPFVEELRNQVAVKRGPIVYCLESTDLIEKTNLSDVVIPNDVQLSPTWEAELLDGVVTLNGNAFVREERDWANKLYKEISQKQLQPKPIRMIPYFAWCNRGKADMTVWMPVK
jgi:DUF1680 family protein